MLEQKYLDNLSKLADYLENNVNNNQFNIDSYRLDDAKSSVYFKSINDCGTIGCALGWAPFVNGLEAILDDYNYQDNLSFPSYSNRVFKVSDTEWNYLFSNEWKGTPQETREATIKRIRKFVSQKGKLLDEDIRLMAFIFSY